MRVAGQAQRLGNLEFMRVDLHICSTMQKDKWDLDPGFREGRAASHHRVPCCLTPAYRKAARHEFPGSLDKQTAWCCDKVKTEGTILQQTSTPATAWDWTLGYITVRRSTGRQSNTPSSSTWRARKELRWYNCNSLDHMAVQRPTGRHRDTKPREALVCDCADDLGYY